MHLKSLRIIVILALALVANVTHAEDVVDGVIGMTPVEASSCLAVYVPLVQDQALAGIMWYNNDGSVVFPEVLVASGVAGYPEPVSSAFPVAINASGTTSGWSELTFSEPLVSLADGLYVVFRLPEGSEHEFDGLGGGAGIGYTTGANGYTGWLSIDGEQWIQLHADFGMAVQPITVPAEEGMMAKSQESEGELPITHTALLLPVPNPFNPQTELFFQLKDASNVELSIYNVKGERVARLVTGVHSAGRHSVFWRGDDSSGRRLSSGAYFARMVAGHVVQTQRLSLVK